ncbi:MULTISPECIES: TetR family transcriptional regulator [unclassified Sphingobium]|uniref:TetR family transcriptional regulator n=1 Tax=unclassified Sphingobium TaxID=2611147 RepID=UPI0022247193|nr:MULTISPECIES: TetR family transcriptional regulator [unclassified Sphingobium]MCW2396861.1 TetR/AcrR family tetracycline transcriptional repressor [Sphingobium sp. B8D3B]MCW2417067.1 TetR/AcrR family tetracycline transcriptional repressor [Sphingobium sp. B8D3C]
MSFAKLDQDGIVEEAIALLKEEGLAAVSLRKIATRLSVSVSSLYWHVEDKQALHALMSISIFKACLDSVPPAESWWAWLHDFGIALWDAQTSIRDARQLIAVTRAQRGTGNHFIGQIVKELTALGLSAEMAAVAQRSVQALVTGWTTLRAVQVEADRDSFILALDVLIDGWRTRAGADQP